MKSILSRLGLVAALVFALAATSFGQEALFKNQTTGSIIKAGAGGIADNFTTGTATSTAAAATLNTDSGKITTESLTIAPQAVYTFVLTNSLITAATNKVFVSFETTSTGIPVVSGCAIDGTAHTATIKIANAATAGGASFNSTFKISFLLAK